MKHTQLTSYWGKKQSFSSKIQNKMKMPMRAATNNIVLEFIAIVIN